jgi:hypothetical protein
VVRAYSESGRHVMQATVAATAYLAARNLMCAGGGFLFYFFNSNFKLFK